MTSPKEAARYLAEQAGISPNGDKPQYRLRTFDLADIEPKAVTWIWPQRIPRGKFSMLAGDPGLGKSYLSLDIATRISLGSHWPDGGKVDQGKVLLISVEDGLEDTIRPRLDLLGADLRMIRAIDSLVESDEEQKALSLEDHLQLLEVEILAYEAVLLILDPILAFTGKSDTHKASQVRAMVAPLAAMADRTLCSILAIIHLNKKSGEMNSVYRLTGSLDFAAAARSVMVVGKHPDDANKRVLCPVKMNLSAMPDSLEYYFTSDGYFDWGDAVKLDANDLLNIPSQDDKSAREQAKDFLCDILMDGPMVANDVWDSAKQHGISQNTLRRAKDDIGVVIYRNQISTGKKGNPGYVWSLVPPEEETVVG